MLGYHLKKNVKPIVKHPFFAFIVFGLVLILLQILSWTAGFPKSSAMSGIATVLIYSIVGFGFTYLLWDTRGWRRSARRALRGWEHI